MKLAFRVGGSSLRGTLAGSLYRGGFSFLLNLRRGELQPLNDAEQTLVHLAANPLTLFRRHRLQRAVRRHLAEQLAADRRQIDPQVRWIEIRIGIGRSRPFGQATGGRRSTTPVASTRGMRRRPSWPGPAEAALSPACVTFTSGSFQRRVAARLRVFSSAAPFPASAQLAGTIGWSRRPLNGTGTKRRFRGGGAERREAATVGQQRAWCTGSPPAASAEPPDLDVVQQHRDLAERGGHLCLDRTRIDRVGDDGDGL